MHESLERKPGKIGKRLRILAGVAVIGAANTPVPKAEAFHQQQALEAHEQFNAQREAEAFLEKIATMPFRQRSTPSALTEMQFNNLARSLEQKVPYFSILDPESLMAPAAPGGATTSIARERAKQVLLPLLNTLDTKIKLGEPGTLEGRRKNNLSILQEVLEKMAVSE